MAIVAFFIYPLNTPFSYSEKWLIMAKKTESDIALEMKRLREQKRQIVRDRNLALGVEISRAIKAGNLDQDFIMKAIDATTKSKKHRAVLGLDSIQSDPELTPPTLPNSSDKLSSFKSG